MTRASRNVLLGLVGSSALFGSYVGYCEYHEHQRRLEQQALAAQGAGGDFGPDQDQQAKAPGGAGTTTGSGTTHHSYSRSHSWWWGGSGRSYTSGGTSGVGSSRPSTDGGSTGSVTTRGGFGSTGHAASGSGGS